MKKYNAIKICLCVALILCVVLGWNTLDVKAETGTGTVKGSGVNVRSDAGTASAKVSTLNNGDALVVTGSKTDAAGNKWYAVTFVKNGKEYKGYIISNYVNYKATEISTGTQQQNGEDGAGTAQQPENSTAGTSSKWKAKVTASNVNVRSSAVSGGVIGTVTTGANVTVRKQTTGTDGKVWYYISCKINGSTKKGWIRSDFVKKTETQVSDNGNASTQAPSGDGVTEVDVSEYVERERPDNTQGDSPKEEETPKEEKPSARKGVMTGNYVRIRKKPVSGAVVCQLMSGTELTIKGEKKGSDNIIWYKVTFEYQGTKKTGYVRSDFVKIKETPKPEVDDKKDDNVSSGEKQGMLNGDYVRVRKSPVSGAIVCQLMRGAQLIIVGEKDGSDGKLWYEVTFVYNNENKTGYVRSDFVTVQETSDEDETTGDEISQDADFEGYMTAQGFPESYKESLRKLHASHPEWVFKAVATGLKWEDVIAAESQVGKNLVTKNAVTSWKSTEKTAYNRKNNTWYTFDGGAWVAASKEIISYYMDPRNFLEEKTIFQFESLEFEDYQNTTGVKRLLEGSFMSGDYIEPDGDDKSYARTFVKIGRQVGVNPYHLAARCYQEQGSGKSGSISGKVAGYENIFNYYNIGAYAANGNSPVVQGLIYASSSTGGSTNYDRPWNTHYKALLGGAKYVAQKYVKVGQNTLYFQKFNVVNKKNGIYRHQYMTNVQAAESEAVKMSKAYTQEDTKLVFYIPVYENMPDTVCAKPQSNANPNNYLAEIKIKDQNLTPVFDPETENYDLTVPKKVKKVSISATAVASTSVVEGTGKVKLSRGENVVKITCRAENGSERIYTIHIVRE